jgi:hypothetical protein
LPKARKEALIAYVWVKLRLYAGSSCKEEKWMSGKKEESLVFYQNAWLKSSNHDGYPQRQNLSWITI